MVVLVLDRQEGLCLYEPTLWQRTRARFFADGIDLALAAGANPDSSVLLALRAMWLMRSRQRIGLADGYVLLVRNAELSDQPLLTNAVSRRDVVRSVRGELLQLAALLRNGGPVSVRGVAKAHLLLTDGASQLHRPDDGDSLRAALADAIQSLGPLPAGC